MEKSYVDASNNIFDTKDWIPKQWENLNVTHLYSAPQQTGVKIPLLREIGEKISTLPTNFNFHPQIRKIYENRLNSIATGKGIDWATAEALAWSTLIKEGYVVRISGQDVERGTFSHRHSVLHDQIENRRFIPIHNICNDVSEFQSCNSHLSEFAVLGFEFGFSIYNPDGLILWEAQFGDFANGAQIIIDQFISSCESKWNIANGLVLLLPHGMDGQGAEHSSCRIERFLQLCDDDPREIPDFNEDKVWQIQKINMQVPTLLILGLQSFLCS